MKRALTILALLLSAACVPPKPPVVVPPVPPIVPPPISEAALLVSVTDAQTGGAITAAHVHVVNWKSEAVADLDSDARGRTERRGLEPGDYAGDVTAPGYLPARFDQVTIPRAGDAPLLIAMTPAIPPLLPLPARAEFARTYQGNFAGIPLPGYGLHRDILFDPILLPMWIARQDSANPLHGAFDAAIAAHRARGDTRVVVSPAICYHQNDVGGYPCADVWHDPPTFRAFLMDLRRARLEPLVIWVQGEHPGFGSFLQAGQEGVPSPDTEAHAMRDLEAMAAVTQDLVAGTAPAWEPRHQRDWMTAGTFERLAQRVAQLWPHAWHGIHLIQQSSSWSSWRCDPAQDPTCPPSAAEGDDPNRGNEITAWARCRAAGWCDGQLFQAVAGDEFTCPENHPNSSGLFGWADRWKEVVDRIGSGGHSWPLADLIFFEAGAYDAVNGGANEALQIHRCKEAMAIGGLACGNASVPPPKR